MRALLDLLFPPACLSCGVASGRALCSVCDARAERIGVCCARCGLPAARPRASCRACEGLAFDAARAPFVYAGVARDALMTFKLGGERRAAPDLAIPMTEVAPAADIVTFVPATRRSVAARGFNPAEVLARAVARRMGVSCVPLLGKVRETVDQAGLGRADRRRNQAGAYAALPGVTRASGASILLVDDVMTTGATAGACAEKLRAADPAEVAVLTLARAR